MLEDFRSRMGDLREEMDTLAQQAEELETVARNQQSQLEELEFLIRQRDEQLVEQQSRIDELTATLEERERELAELRSHLEAGASISSQQDQELQELRNQLAQRESKIQALQEQLSQAETLLLGRTTEVGEEPLQQIVARLSSLENRLVLQDESLIQIRSLVQEEVSHLRQGLANIEATLAKASLPPVVPVPAAEEVSLVPPTEEVLVLPAEKEIAVVPPAEGVAEEAVAVLPEEEFVLAPLPEDMAIADVLESLLQESLNNLPTAKAVGLFGRDGLNVETAKRPERELDELVYVELADFVGSTWPSMAALDMGTLMTLAFRSGDETYLLSPLNEDYFAFLLAELDSADQLRHAQAVLLQTISRLSDYF
ncbi:MAG: hypothetical protein JXA37_14295 [Chloroflexia bacterium]|nr:hypothetical protein [Chloroflexia bacterium]